MAYLSLLAAQLLYTLSDIWKKTIFNAQGFHWQTLVRPAFLLTLLLAGVGFLFQMFALSKIEMSRTIISMGMMAVIFSAIAGTLYLKESLSLLNWAGVIFALVAIVLVNWR